VTAQRSQIEPPPSLEDILSAGDHGRVGSVDFSHLADPATQPIEAPPVAQVTEVAAAPVVAPLEADPDPEPVVLVEPEPEPAVVDETEDQDEVEDEDDVVAEAPEADEAPEPAEELDEPQDPVQPGPDTVAEPEAAPAFDLDLPENGTAPTVEEMAATVIAQMRAAQAATERHLEAIEVEAARRCELLTAQAELDAELIRLHARREAHAIIAAAQMHTGQEAGTLEENQRIGEIGETFSRFAESLESVVATATTTTDTPRGRS
jgi:hypothetical protein